MGHEPIKSKYVVGFLFTEDRQQLALIRKEKPAWQRGLLNGIGGKIEQGESPLRAMAREFAEETEVATPLDWQPFAVLSGTDFMIHFFKAFAPKELFYELRSPTDEEVVIVTPEFVPSLDSHVIPNLRWLVPMALDNVIASVVDAISKE